MTRIDDSFHWHAGYELMLRQAEADQQIRQERRTKALLWLLRHGPEPDRDVAIMLGLLPDDGTATA